MTNGRITRGDLAEKASQAAANARRNVNDTAAAVATRRDAETAPEASPAPGGQASGQ